MTTPAGPMKAIATLQRPSRGSRQRGQSLVEGTLVMLVFFALLLGTVDFGQVIFAHQALVERVRSAARWGSLHPENGADPVRNLVLYGHPDAPSPGDATFLNLTADNVVVRYDGLDQQDIDVRTLHVEVINFEAPMFAPWWPGFAHRFMNPRPVSVTAPVTAPVAAK